MPIKQLEVSLTDFHREVEISSARSPIPVRR
jgi:hypothetical protein